MATQDDVNRQHLAMAGVDPDTLGKPQEVPEEPKRCQSRAIVQGVDNGRCALSVGHEGRHVRGTLSWDERVPEKSKTRPGDQPLPVPNDHPDIQSMVIADIEARRELGIQRYGTALQPGNERDMLLDAYEEAMDLTIYLKGAIVERDLRVAEEPEKPLDQDEVLVKIMAALDEMAGPAESGLEMGRRAYYAAVAYNVIVYGQPREPERP